jgi:2-oxoglutarate ferredoxin oxidoreductase subunit delta
MSGVTKHTALPRFDAHRCKRCGLCAALCPAEAIEPARRPNGSPFSSGPSLLHPESCTGCTTCELVCPDFAIIMVSP